MAAECVACEGVARASREAAEEGAGVRDAMLDEVIELVDKEGDADTGGIECG